MSLTAEQVDHPVPANERNLIPCGCHLERRNTPDGGWVYIHYVRQTCERDGKRLGTRQHGHLYVHETATESEIDAAANRLGLEIK